MIVLADLDNTLVDRKAAFTAWASAFVADMGGTPSDEAWLLHEDADGYRPRAALAQAVIGRFQLSVSCEQFVDRLLHEHVELTRPYPGITSRLEALAVQGTRIVVVTNGTVRQQRAKLTRTGLLALVDDVVISEAVGSKKPDQRIFETAIGRALSIGGAGCTWMVGDHPIADIAGARDCGLHTGWVSHGTAWSADWSPTITACTSVEVLDLLLTATTAQPRPTVLAAR